MEVCEKCGKPDGNRWGRHGRFMACSAYPECKNTREIARRRRRRQREGRPRSSKSKRSAKTADGL